MNWRKQPATPLSSARPTNTQSESCASLCSDRRCLLEYLDRDYRELPPPDGTRVVPGHAIESMWFIMHLARRRGDRAMADRAAEVMRWHVEKGWDEEYGGLFLGIDADGGEPSMPNLGEEGMVAAH
jgi:mannose/cellobiose epimerase-like protein (N-acyl-D-glucosamine 2-epimerase family)